MVDNFYKYFSCQYLIRFNHLSSCSSLFFDFENLPIINYKLYFSLSWLILISFEMFHFSNVVRVLLLIWIYFSIILFILPLLILISFLQEISRFLSLPQPFGLISHMTPLYLTFSFPPPLLKVSFSC